jgi:hypothetical protein
VSGQGTGCATVAGSISADDGVPAETVKTLAVVIKTMTANKPQVGQYMKNRGYRVYVKNQPTVRMDDGREVSGFFDNINNTLFINNTPMCNVGNPDESLGIFIHEFAHSLSSAIRATEADAGVLGDARWGARLRNNWIAVKDSPQYAGSYAATNEQEYWAVESALYFKTRSPEKIQQSDPVMYGLLQEVYGAPRLFNGCQVLTS